MKSRRKVGQFSATITEPPPVKINGAKYDAVDTGDGWFTLKDVLCFGEVPSGVKGAPEDVKAERMQQMVTSALTKYEKEKFAAPAHKGHHKALALEDPQFCGFFLPKKVGRTMLDGREQDCVFADIKVRGPVFEKIKNGELPYVSPEVNWENWEFSSIAFLDSMPPHFKGPIITVGKVMKDPAAKFTVGSTISMGKFTAVGGAPMEDDGNKDGQRDRSLKTVKENEKEDTARDGGHDDAKMCAHCAERMNKMEASYAAMDKTMADIHFKMGLPYKGAQMGADLAPGKPDSSAPREDSAGKQTKEKKEDAMKFEDDPALVAKFAAQEARTKTLEDKLAAKEAEEAKKQRIDAAFAELEGYPLTDAGKAGIAKFADDPEKLKTFLEVLKAQTPKNPPRTVSEFESSGKEVKVAISGNDADLAAFQTKGPEAMEAALKYAARFEAMKADKACRGSRLVQEGRKVYIEQMMELDPTGNFGRKA